MAANNLTTLNPNLPDLEAALEIILKSDRSTVTLLKGKWGVGKSYFIQWFLEKYKSEFSTQPIANVSLFGIDTIEALEKRVFIAKILSARRVGILPNRVISLLENFSDSALEGLGDFLVNVKFHGSIEALIKIIIKSSPDFLKRKAIIILDDLERHSDKISITSILGLAVKLRDTDNCHVIIVSNEEGIRKEDIESYNTYREKVFDREIEFLPTVQYALQCGLRIPNEKILTATFCEKLNVYNIRTILRISNSINEVIQRISDTTYPLTDDLEKEIKSTLVLAVWAFLERKIDLSSVKDMSYAKYWDATSENGELEKDKADQIRQIYNYGYTQTLALDEVLIDYVTTGIINSAALKNALDIYHAEAEKAAALGAYDESWITFRSSFNLDMEDFIFKLHRSAINVIPYIDPYNLDRGIERLRDLNKGDLADNIIDVFLTESPYAKNSIALEAHPFFQIHDKKFRSVINNLQPKSDTRTIEEAVQSYVDSQYPIENDIVRLCEFSEQEYFEYFMRLDIGEMLRRASLLARPKDRLPSVEDGINLIQKRAERSLLKIAELSSLNNIQVNSVLKNS